MRKNKVGNYPEDWNEIALEIKAAANFMCEHCGRPHNPPKGYTLTVHHLDADTANQDKSNLVALCQRCHLHFQNKDLKNQLWLFGTPTFLARRFQGS